jgi:integrase/recombinase XerD
MLLRDSETQRTSLLHSMRSFLDDQRAQHHSPGTLRFYRQKFALFLKFLDDRPEIQSLFQVTAGLVRSYLIWLEDTGHNPGGCHAGYRALKALIYFYEKEEMPTWRNPIRGMVKAPKVPDNILDPVPREMIDKLLKFCDPNEYYGARDRAILCLLRDSGARASELCALDYENVNMDTRTIKILPGKSKGGDPGFLFFDPPTKKELKRWFRFRGEKPGPLFINRYHKRLKYDGLRAMVERISERAGEEDAPLLHGFRRLFGKEMLEINDMLTTSRLLRHKDTATVKRYAKHDEEDLRRAYRRREEMRD